MSRLAGRGPLICGVRPLQRRAAVGLTVGAIGTMFRLSSYLTGTSTLRSQTWLCNDRWPWPLRRGTACQRLVTGDTLLRYPQTGFRYVSKILIARQCVIDRCIHILFVRPSSSSWTLWGTCLHYQGMFSCPIGNVGILMAAKVIDEDPVALTR